MPKLRKKTARELKENELKENALNKIQREYTSPSDTNILQHEKRCSWRCCGPRCVRNGSFSRFIDDVQVRCTPQIVKRCIKRNTSGYDDVVQHGGTANFVSLSRNATTSGFTYKYGLVTYSSITALVTDDETVTAQRRYCLFICRNGFYLLFSSSSVAPLLLYACQPALRASFFEEWLCTTSWSSARIWSMRSSRVSKNFPHTSTPLP